MIISFNDVWHFWKIMNIFWPKIFPAGFYKITPLSNIELIFWLDVVLPEKLLICNHVNTKIRYSYIVLSWSWSFFLLFSFLSPWVLKMEKIPNFKKSSKITRPFFFFRILTISNSVGYVIACQVLHHDLNNFGINSRQIKS